jgi:molecular chaperone DnaK (HSP70)
VGRGRAWVIIANDQGNLTTTSYVAFTNSERLVSDTAKNQVTMNPINQGAPPSRPRSRTSPPTTTTCSASSSSLASLRRLKNKITITNYKGLIQL